MTVEQAFYIAFIPTVVLLIGMLFSHWVYDNGITRVDVQDAFCYTVWGFFLFFGILAVTSIFV